MDTCQRIHDSKKGTCNPCGMGKGVLNVYHSKNRLLVKVHPKRTRVPKAYPGAQSVPQAGYIITQCVPIVPMAYPIPGTWWVRFITSTRGVPKYTQLSRYHLNSTQVLPFNNIQKSTATLSIIWVLPKPNPAFYPMYPDRTQQLPGVYPLITPSLPRAYPAVLVLWVPRVT